MPEVIDGELSLSSLAGNSKNLSTFNYGKLPQFEKYGSGTYYNETIDADQGPEYNHYWTRNTNWSVQIPPVEVTPFMAAYISNSPHINWDPLTLKDSNQADFDYIYEIAKKSVRTAQKRKRDFEDQVKKYADECIATKKKKEEELENSITMKKKEKHKLFLLFQDLLNEDTESLSSNEEDASIFPSHTPPPQTTPHGQHHMHPSNIQSHMHAQSHMQTPSHTHIQPHSQPPSQSHPQITQPYTGRASSRSSSEDIMRSNGSHQYGQPVQSPHSMEEMYHDQHYEQYIPDYAPDGYIHGPYGQQHIRKHQSMHSYGNVYDSRAGDGVDESHRPTHHPTGLTIQTQGHGIPPRGSNMWQQSEPPGRRQPLTPQTPRPPQTQPRYIPNQEPIHSYGHRSQSRGPSSHRRSHQDMHGGSRHQINSPTRSGPRGMSGRGSPRRLGPPPITGPSHSSHPSHGPHSSHSSHGAHSTHTNYSGSGGRRSSNPISPRGSSRGRRGFWNGY